MKEKFNCYQCKYHCRVEGSAHSKCLHPSLAQVSDNPMIELLATFASVGRVSPFQFNSNELNIKANDYGVRNGWFNFPCNFDPTWLENCDGFIPKVKGKYRADLESKIRKCENGKSCEECDKRHSCWTESE